MRPHLAERFEARVKEGLPFRSFQLSEPCRVRIQHPQANRLGTYVVVSIVVSIEHAAEGPIALPAL